MDGRFPQGAGVTYTAVYDLAVSPVSYDVIAFLVQARLIAGDNALHVAIEPKVDGGFSEGGFSRVWGGYDEAEARWRLWNIVIPACQLVGATVELRQVRGGKGAHFGHSIAPLVAAARAGTRIPQLRASDRARAIVNRRYPVDEASFRPITITMRRTGEPARDSDRDAWQVFRRRLEDAGRRVVFINDVRDELDLDSGGAMLSIDLRLALYERAAMNFGVQNGPMALCQFSAAPYLQFGCGGHLREGFAENWAKHWRDFGLAEGDQLPWAAENQRLVYAPDSAANILNSAVRAGL